MQRVLYEYIGAGLEYSTRSPRSVGPFSLLCQAAASRIRSRLLVVVRAEAGSKDRRAPLWHAAAARTCLDERNTFCIICTRRPAPQVRANVAQDGQQVTTTSDSILLTRRPLILFLAAGVALTFLGRFQAARQMTGAAHATGGAATLHPKVRSVTIRLSCSHHSAPRISNILKMRLQA
jgi:hypothetical protein